MSKKKNTEHLINDDEIVSQNTMNVKQSAAQNISTSASVAELKKAEIYYKHLAAIVELSDDAIICKSLDGFIKT